MLAVVIVTSQAESTSPSTGIWAFDEKCKEMTFLLVLLQWWESETFENTFSGKVGEKWVRPVFIPALAGSKVILHVHGAVQVGSAVEGWAVLFRAGSGV